MMKMKEREEREDEKRRKEGRKGALMDRKGMLERGGRKGRGKEGLERIKGEILLWLRERGFEGCKSAEQSVCESLILSCKLGNLWDSLTQPSPAPCAQGGAASKKFRVRPIGPRDLCLSVFLLLLTPSVACTRSIIYFYPLLCAYLILCANYSSWRLSPHFLHFPPPPPRPPTKLSFPSILHFSASNCFVYFFLLI